MTLNQIAEAIDAQILRMQKVRAIVANLLPAKSPLTSPVRNLEKLPPPDATPLAGSPTQSAAPAHLMPRVEQQPRGPKVRKPRTPRVTAPTRELSPTALGGAIPRGPIFVSAADAVRSRQIIESPSAARAVVAPSESGHSLDDLVLQLTRRSTPSLLPTH